MKQSFFAFAAALLVWGAFAGSAAATAQAPDIIVIDGEQHPLYSNPLEIWLKDNPEADGTGMDGSSDDRICISSGNWRGYIATFAIEGKRFLLRRVETSACGERPSRDSISTLFDGEENVDVDWYSGILVIPTGERVSYVHLGYGSLYSEYRLFRVEAGRVVAETRMDAEQYSGYRERQFEAYKRTAAYVQAFADLSKGDSEGPDRMESFLYSVDTDYTSEMMLPFPEAASAKK